jgi:tyrosine-specific transport protein
VALITGSTVGAGMLALPAVTAPAGFGPTAAGLVALWGVLLLEALLLAEVNLALMGAEGEEGGGGGPRGVVTLRQMAEQTLGVAGKGEP